MSAAWSVLDRNPPLPFEHAAIPALTIAKDFYDQGEHLKQHNSHILRTHLGEFHRAMLRERFWGDATEAFSKTFEELPYDMRLNYTVLLLAAIVAHNKLDPAEKTMESDFESIMWWLVRAWRCRFNDTDRNTGLKWEETTEAVLDALKQLLDEDLSIGALDSPEFLTLYCRKTHEIMKERNLWRDECGSDPYQIVYDELPCHMRDNYVLIVEAALAAISEAEKRQ